MISVWVFLWDAGRDVGMTTVTDLSDAKSLIRGAATCVGHRQTHEDFLFGKYASIFREGKKKNAFCVLRLFSRWCGNKDDWLSGTDSERQVSQRMMIAISKRQIKGFRSTGTWLGRMCCDWWVTMGSKTWQRSWSSSRWMEGFSEPPHRRMNRFEIKLKMCVLRLIELKLFSRS